MAVERRPLSAYGAGLARQLRPQRRRDRDDPQAGLRGRLDVMASALALVLPGDGWPVWQQQRHGMGRQPLQAVAGLTGFIRRRWPSVRPSPAARPIPAGRPAYGLRAAP